VLPFENRLKKNKEIKQVFDGGKRFQQGFLALKAINNSLQQSRFAFIASQRLSKKASTRNRVKRHLREIISLKIKEIKTGKDIVVIASPGFIIKDFQESREDLEKLLLKAKLIKK